VAESYVNIQVDFFWVAAQLGYQRFKGEDGGSMDLLHVGILPQQA